MKVAHLTTVDLSLRYLVFAQLQSLIELDIEAIGISSPGPWVDDITAAGITHIPLTASTRGIAPLADIQAAVQLWKTLRRERPDILHTHNPKPGLYGRILGRWAKVPIVINTVHGLYAAPDDPLVKRVIVYGLEAFAARFSDLELVQSQEDLAIMRRLRITKPGQGRLLGNGIDLTRYNPERTDGKSRSEIRQELGIPENQIVVGMVGRLVAEKGYPELFEAASQLGDAYTVLAIGPEDFDKPDALPESLVRRAKSDGVRFLGMRTDLDDLYRAMDIFVLPSHREGFPRAAMEAASMGLPIIATDIRGCREVVDPDSNGILIPVRSPGALRDAITRLGDDIDTRRRFGSASRAKALGSFDEGRIVERVLDAYREAAETKGLVHYREQLGEGRQSLMIRPARQSDSPALARMHIEGIVDGFLPRLGVAFMERLYRAMVEFADATVLVADRGAGPIGFVSGVSDTGAFYRHFLKRHGVMAALAASRQLVRPALLRKAWETARYGGGNGESGAYYPRAELLSMAIEPSHRREGLGLKLGTALLAAMRDQGQRSVKVVVGNANEPAIAAYERMGFVPTGTVEVHPGEVSRVLVWSG